MLDIDVPTTIWGLFKVIDKNALMQNLATP